MIRPNTAVELASRVASRLFIPFTVGGGIRSVEDFRAILREGADKVSVNSAAIERPELISEAADKFGSQCVTVAIDAKKKGDGRWTVYKNGGRIDVGLDVVEWAMKAEKLGAGEILLTSMDGDGTKDGYDIGLTKGEDSGHCLRRGREEGGLRRGLRKGPCGCGPGSQPLSLQRAADC